MKTTITQLLNDLIPINSDGKIVTIVKYINDNGLFKKKSVEIDVLNTISSMKMQILFKKKLSDLRNEKSNPKIINENASYKELSDIYTASREKRLRFKPSEATQSLSTPNNVTENSNKERNKQQQKSRKKSYYNHQVVDYNTIFINNTINHISSVLNVDLTKLHNIICHKLDNPKFSAKQKLNRKDYIVIKPLLINLYSIKDNKELIDEALDFYSNIGLKNKKRLIRDEYICPEQYYNKKETFTITTNSKYTIDDLKHKRRTLIKISVFKCHICQQINNNYAWEYKVSSDKNILLCDKCKSQQKQGYMHIISIPMGGQ